MLAHNNILPAYTKFGNSRFVRSGSGDMIAGVKVENGSSQRDPDYAPFRVVCHQASLHLVPPTMKI